MTAQGAERCNALLGVLVDAGHHHQGHHRGTGARLAARRLPAQLGQRGQDLAEADVGPLPHLDGLGPVRGGRCPRAGRASPLAHGAVEAGQAHGVRHCRPSRSMSVSAGRGPQDPEA